MLHSSSNAGSKNIYIKNFTLKPFSFLVLGFLFFSFVYLQSFTILARFYLPLYYSVSRKKHIE